MFYVEDYSDERLKSWCIHCGAAIANVSANRDHVPTKSFLSKRWREAGAAYDRSQGLPDGYLPQILVCKACNAGFSRDETYVLCVLHAVVTGSLYPDSDTHPDAANVLRSNRDIVRSLKAGPDGQLFLFDGLQPFTLYPEPDRVRKVVVKNARGHAYHEIGESLLEEPSSISFQPLQSMSNDERATFENGGGRGLDLLPEVGSRMMVRVIEGVGLAGGWVEVNRGRYRYSVNWSAGVSVRTIIWDYLATETHWDP